MSGSVEKTYWSKELRPETQIQQLLILHEKLGNMLVDVEILSNEFLIYLLTRADLEIAHMIQQTQESHECYSE